MRLFASFLLVTLPLLAEKYHLNPSPVDPSAIGEVDVDHDNNGNARIDLKVEHLARPASLTPSKTTYLVWAQTPEGRTEALGELKVNNDLKGELKTVTPLRNFELLITAEDDPHTTQPMGPVVMRGSIHEGK